MQPKKWIQIVYFSAGAVNVIGIPIFSKLFTNGFLTDIDSATFSTVGLIAIMIWGLAYMSVAKVYYQVPLITGVFAIEKFFYTSVWINWICNHGRELGTIYQQDVVTGFFYSVYGINDFLIGIFFLYVLFKERS